MFWKTIFIAFLAVAVLADVNKLSNTYGNRLKSLSEDECQENGPNRNLDTFEKTVASIENCLWSFFNLDDLKEELRNAKTKAVINEIFQERCEKKPQLKTCVHNLMKGYSRCEDASTQSRIASAMNIADQLADFVCYNNGESGALFLTEKGTQCCESKVDDVADCLEVHNAPNFIDSNNLSTEEKCTKYDQASSCVFAVLNTCDNPVSANVFESLMKYIRKASPCNHL
ncbi:hypothetical protein K1T71_004330 [Dendrolimus kikuchii]|uniref:Uncharacterized protein n=1 Tax=Dendrolimus kikuchii TaxID=765133 RepID=A0ACC1D7L5_9NEOP|nr:hypothetical protein K1T71_004330 [Dendrolimus kikuchii]